MNTNMKSNMGDFWKKSLSVLSVGLLVTTLIPSIKSPVVVDAGNLNRTFNVTNGNSYTGANNDNSSGSLGVAPIFSSPRGIYNWTVPVSGIYSISAQGAQGGDTAFAFGGKGTLMQGEFNLTEGTVLKILVGQQPAKQKNSSSNYSSGGGGGTFVTKVDNTPLIVAGGGGGGHDIINGMDASVTTSGTTSSAGTGIPGSDGKAGGRGNSGSGGGLTTNAPNGSWDTSADTGGKAFINGGNGGTFNNYSYEMGGFGGGGATHGNCLGGGGGGGYSGGANNITGCYGGGGGGSYNSGDFQSNRVATTTGHGFVNIELVINTSLNSPANNYNTGENAINLSWNTVYGTAYEIRIGTTTGADDILGTINKGNTLNHTFNVPTGLTANKNFYWAVRAQNKTGTWGEWSERKLTFVPATISAITPTEGTSFQDSYVNIGWTGSFGANTSIGEYEIKAGKTAGATDILAVTSKGTGTTHKLDIPANTPGNTTIYVNVRAKSNLGYWGPWKQQTVLFANNRPVISGTFTGAEKDLTVSLDQRIMNFKVTGITDPDTFNYVKLQTEVKSGSTILGKQQIGSNLTGPVSWTAKNYKLRLIPTFAMNSTYDLVVVDAADENNILATLVNDRPMQSSTAPSPETFTFNVFAEDYQKTTNGNLSMSNLLSQSITVDTRNYLPAVSKVKHDINNRIMSSNQGFNRVKFSGTLTDLDPADGINIYYTVKLASDKVAGKYVVNPGGDTLIKTISSSGNGATGTFDATYTIQENLPNGDYVLLAYGQDTRGGIGDPVVMNFTVTKTNPDIRFYANYNGNTLSTAERQILAKNSKLKMYFSAYDYTTFEYAGYLVRSNQQNASGTYEDLKIRGAFTNDVPSQFIGVDLSDPLFNKGDMLVFKFRAISSTGVKINKDVRILIGDQNNTVVDVANNRIPTTLLTNN